MSECFAKSEFDFLDGDIATDDGNLVKALRMVRILKAENAQLRRELDGARAKCAEGVLAIREFCACVFPAEVHGSIDFLRARDKLVVAERRLRQNSPTQLLLDELAALREVLAVFVEGKRVEIEDRNPDEDYTRFWTRQINEAEALSAAEVK